MENTRNFNLEKIKKTSRIFKTLSTVFIYFLIFGMLVGTLGIIFVNSPDAIIKLNNTELTFDQVTPLIRMIAIAILVVVGSLLIKAFHHLKKLFILFGSGEIFTKGTVQEIRNLGYLLLFWAGANVLISIAEFAVLVIANLNDSSSLFLEPSGFALPLFVGFVVLVVSRIMDEGRKLQEDSELTI